MEPFGSFLTNLFTRRGDLDISIEINNGLLVPSSGKLQKLIVLRDLMRTMRERGRFVFHFFFSFVIILIHRRNPLWDLYVIRMIFSSGYLSFIFFVVFVGGEGC